jgi:hypothetical protein
MTSPSRNQFSHVSLQFFNGKTRKYVVYRGAPETERVKTYISKAVKSLQKVVFTRKREKISSGKMIDT